MGVRYFVAYSLHDKTPDALRAPIERHAYYAWLYAGDLDYDARRPRRLPRRARRRFVGRNAVVGREYAHDRAPRGGVRARARAVLPPGRHPVRARAAQGERRTIPFPGLALAASGTRRVRALGGAPTSRPRATRWTLRS